MTPASLARPLARLSPTGSSSRTGPATPGRSRTSRRRSASSSARCRCSGSASATRSSPPGVFGGETHLHSSPSGHHGAESIRVRRIATGVVERHPRRTTGHAVAGTPPSPIARSRHSTSTPANDGVIEGPRASPPTERSRCRVPPPRPARARTIVAYGLFASFLCPRVDRAWRTRWLEGGAPPGCRRRARTPLVDPRHRLGPDRSLRQVRACEFDYSWDPGVPRCLRAEGHRVILANSNPAARPHDRDPDSRSYRTYIAEPSTHDDAPRSIVERRPSLRDPCRRWAGRSSLNLAMELDALRLADPRQLQGVRLIGAATIQRSRRPENRELFKVRDAPIARSGCSSQFVGLRSTPGRTAACRSAQS